MKAKGEFWFCDAIGEAWDTELHDETPCDRALQMYGVGGVTDDKEHARCGPCSIRLLKVKADA